MLRRIVASLVHHMGRVTKPEISKESPLMEVKAPKIPPTMNRTP
jgi:hypothetical protein